jgi:hypothetical protein
MNKPSIDWNNKNIVQGILILGAGILLLLYTLGIIETGINLILILGAIGLIAYGGLALGLDGVIRKWLGK